MGLRPLQKKVLETIGLYVNESIIPSQFRGGVSGDDFFIRFKITRKLILKKPQSVEALSYLPHHNSNNVRRGKGKSEGNCE